MRDLNEYINEHKINAGGLSLHLSGKGTSKPEISHVLKEFLCMRTPADLCRFVSLPFNELEKAINDPIYYEMWLDKSNGKGKRLIQAPTLTLKMIQRSLNSGFASYYSKIRTESAHGFVRRIGDVGFGIVTNALPHTKKDFVLSMDLKDFFPSISAFQVKEVLDSELFQFPSDISTALALLMTYKGRLPQGAPTSPTISNYVCIPLDLELEALARKNQMDYTRYADDLTFSGMGTLNEELLLEISGIINRFGFTINEKKTRMKRKGRKQQVTGLVVNDKVNLDRKMIKQIRAMLHDATQNGWLSAVERHFQRPPDHELVRKFRKRLGGYIALVAMVRGREDTLYLNFKEQFVSLGGENQNTSK